jgi:class 3 adenylate cyclase/DNA-binding winged helix-turn-helix (wHTH) protein/tetratricopeptide (TPR) repeat protein
MRYVFGDYTLDAEQYELHRAGQRVPVEPRIFDLLACLVQRSGRTVPTEELLAQLYPNEFAPVERLTNAVAQARKVLDDTAQTQHYIQTVRRRGYRFRVPVTPQPPGAPDPPAPQAPAILRVVEQALVQGHALAAPCLLPPDPQPVALPEVPTASAPVAAGPDMPQAERRHLTVLVCRLLGVAERAEPLDPEDLLDVVWDYHALCAEVVHRFDGYIAQDQGDHLVVYFGYPQAHEDDARRAVHTGLGLVEAMAALNQRRPRAESVRLGVRVGIHTGVVVVRTKGRNEREAFALGNTSTVADQVQGVAGPDMVVVSPTTLHLVERYVDAQALGTYLLEEPAEPVAVYQILSVWGTRLGSDLMAMQGRTPLVGREQEMALLRARWGQVHNGWGQVVLLSGEAGIGKSRLVQGLREHLMGEAYTWVACYASPYYQHSAFYPVVEYVQRWLQWQQDETSEERLAKLEAALGSFDCVLEEVVPLFAALLSLPLGDRYAPLLLTPERQKQQTLAALLAWLRHEAERQPVCLIVEDLHWVDPSTLEWLSLLIDQIPMTRVLLCLTFRPEFQPAWAARSYLTHMTLGRLSPHQTEGMIGQVVGHKPLPAEVMRQVVATTDGVPLFVEELTKMVVELGLIKEREGRYELAGPLPPLAIPATLHDSLMARLDRLGAAKPVAQLGAVIGREFAYEVLQVVAPMDEATLQQGLAQLVNAELLYQRGLPPQAQYLFKHVLIQEAAYQSLLRSTRRQVHQQIAQVFETRFPDMCETEPELLAHHFGRSTEDDKAVQYALRAAEKVQRRWANCETLTYLESALQRLAAMPDTPVHRRNRIDAVLKQGEARFALGQHAEHLAALENIRTLIDEAADPCHRATWSSWIGFLHIMVGSRPEIAIAYCRDAAALAAAHGFDDIRAMADAGLTQAYVCTGDFGAAVAAGERALTLFEAHGAIWWACRVLWHLSTAANDMGAWEQSLAYCRCALEYGQTLNDLRLKIVGWWRTGSTYIQRGDLEQGLQCCAEALALSPGPFDAAMIQAVQGYGLVKAGQEDSGMTDLATAVAWFEQSHLRYTQAQFALFLAEAYLHRGAQEPARLISEEVLTLCQEAGYRHLTGVAERLLGASLLTEEPEAAAGHLAEAVQILQEVGAQNEVAKTWVAQATLQHAAGDVAGAQRLFACALALFETLGTRDEPCRVRHLLAKLSAPREP